MEYYRAPKDPIECPEDCPHCPESCDPGDCDRECIYDVDKEDIVDEYHRRVDEGVEVK